MEKQLADRDKDIEDLRKSSGDAESVRKQLEDLQGRYTKETEDYKAQLASRDYADAMNRAITAKGVKFSSKAAEKAYLADLKEKHLELKDGELTGFDEWHKAQLEAHAHIRQARRPGRRTGGKEQGRNVRAAVQRAVCADTKQGVI